MDKVDKVCIEVIRALGPSRVELVYADGMLKVADGDHTYVALKSFQAGEDKTFFVDVKEYVKAGRMIRSPDDRVTYDWEAIEAEKQGLVAPEWSTELFDIESIVDLIPFAHTDRAMAALHHVCFTPGDSDQSGIWFATDAHIGRYFQDCIGPKDEVFIPVKLLRIVRSLLTLSGDYSATVWKERDKYGLTFVSPAAILTAYYAADTQVPCINKALLIGDIEGLQQKTVSVDTIKTAHDALAGHTALMKCKEKGFTVYSALAFERDELRIMGGPNAGYRIPFQNELSFLFAPDDTGKGQCGFGAKLLYAVLSDMARVGSGDVTLKYRGPYAYACDTGATCIITNGPRISVRDLAIGDTHWLIMPFRILPE